MRPTSDVFYVRIDKNRKLPVTVLCRALGLSTNEDILNFFGDLTKVLATLEKDTSKTIRGPAGSLPQAAPR